MEFIKQHRWCLLIVVVFAVSISSFPHIYNAATTGDPTYFADLDDGGVYIPYAAYAYHNHPTELRDPINPEVVGTFAPPLLILPGVVIGKAINLNPFHIPFLWRIWSGISVAIALYLLLWFFIRNRFWTTVTSLFIFHDCGVQNAHMLHKQFRVLYNVMVHGIEGPISVIPNLLLQWRIMTPGLSYLFLLMAILGVSHAVRNPDGKKNWIIAGIGCGVLYYIYFYFWTTISLALFLFFLVFAERRKELFIAGITTILVGLPAVISNFLFKQNANPEWLPRLDYFLPIDRFSEFLIPRIAIVSSLLLGIWVWKNKMKELYFLWIVGFSAILLTNHQVVTGLQIQNFHFSYIYGISISILFYVLVAQKLKNLKFTWLKPAVLSFLLIFMGIGYFYRVQETTNVQDGQRMITSYQDYNEFIAANATLDWESNAAIAGDNEFTLHLLIGKNIRPIAGTMLNLSPMLTNDEVDIMFAVNDYVRGVPLDEYKIFWKRSTSNFIWGPWARDLQLKEEWYQKMLHLYEEVKKSPMEFVEKYKIKYIAALEKHGTPEVVERFPDQWMMITGGPHRKIWKLIQQ